MLTAKNAIFCIQYCVDFNATQAAIRAGYSEASAGSIGGELIQKPEIIERIEERKAELAAAASLTPEWIIEQWKRLATGNPEDLAKVRRVNCRHCYGYGGEYQWTEIEYRRALDAAINAGKPAPDGAGGFDFDRKAPPNPECQECAGEGIEYVFVQDTDKVRKNSRGLFAGVKQTKDGIEIKLRDQDAALANLAKYLGMSVDRKELSGPGGKPIPMATVTAKDLTDEQLLAMINADET